MGRSLVALTVSLLMALALGTAVARAQEPADRPTCQGAPATVQARADGVLEGTEGADVIVGTASDDVIRGLGGDDMICPDPDGAVVGGDDVVDAGDGADYVLGSPGRDTIRGGASSGYDEQFGSEGDYLLGGEGDDLLIAEANRQTVQPDGDYLVGGPGDDELVGDGTPGEYLQADEGDDLLRVEQGDDQPYEPATYLSGGDGQDRLLGGPRGHELLQGGAGDDEIHGAGATGESADTILGDEGADRLFGSVAYIGGGPGNDRIVGERLDGTTSPDQRPDVLDGQDGRDRLIGASAGEVLQGGPGDDVLQGRAGDDVLLGGDGVDVLDGGAGADRFYGGGDTDDLRAADGQTDAVFDCGGAPDHLDADPDADTAVERTGCDTPLPPPAQPQLVFPTPADGARFDLLPTKGEKATFTVWANAGDSAERPALRLRAFTLDGRRVDLPKGLSCGATQTAPSSNVWQECTWTYGGGPNVAYELAADAVNGTRSSETRRYLLSVSPYTYLALGDSYSAGEGVDPYLRDGSAPDGTQDGRTDNRCHRSTSAYATQVLSPSSRRPGQTLYEQASVEPRPGPQNKHDSEANVRTARQTRWLFLACSGAVTDNLLTGDNASARVQRDDRFKEAYTQLGNPAVDHEVDLVTLTIGGNDIGFAPTIEDCYDPRTTCADDDASAKAMLDNLAVRLPILYEQIRERTHGARVLVLGYPQLVPLKSRCAELVPVNADERRFLRRTGDKLNALIKRAATRAGYQFVDPNTDAGFAGHEVCGTKSSGGGRYLNGPDTTTNPPGVDDESFHPTAAGQAAYARLVNDALGG